MRPADRWPWFVTVWAGRPVARSPAGSFAKLSTGTPTNRRRLERLIQIAHQKVYAFAQDHPRYQGMGTTVSALLFLEDKIVCAHVGDSRIYRLRDGRLTQLTKDHTLRDYLLHSGALSREDAGGHPSGHVLMQAVGAAPRLNGIQSLVDELAEGDRYLVCSDGLSDVVYDSEIQEFMRSEPFDDVCDALVRRALTRGGVDNITVIAAGVEATAAKRQAA